MTLIEGVGDEVVQFAGVVLLVVVAALAWWSTNARPDRYRTVLVMRARAHHPVTVTVRTRANNNNNNAIMPTTQQPSSSTTVTSSSESVVNLGTIVETRMVEEPPADVIPLQEMDSIVDADVALMDNNRLHFYRRMNASESGQNQSAAESTSEESETQEESEPASNIQIREMDSIVSAMEAEVSTTCDFFRPNVSNQESTSDTKSKNDDKKNESTPSPSNVESESRTGRAGGDQATSSDVTDDANTRKILIKLKYLNDTLKEVDGSLDELLKDFKRRHFSTELSSDCRVRLIFNGRVLLDDAATLRACGLHDRAVVHCLVHPKRANTQQHGGSSEETPLLATHEVITEGAPPERAWDLENILMTLVSVALTVVWFFRCEYSNMFTASASVALFGLTVFYSVAIFGLYLSDTFHLDRRQAPAPVPNN